MRTVQKLNFANPEHRVFLFDVLIANLETWQHDDSYDPVEQIVIMESRANAGLGDVFIGLVNDEPAGVVWVDYDKQKIGTLHGAMLPRFQNGYHSRWFVREFLAYCFCSLKLNKILVEIPAFNVKADKLLKSVGFEREGLLKEQYFINGVAKWVVILGLTKAKFLKGKKEVKKDVTA